MQECVFELWDFTRSQVERLRVASSVYSRTFVTLFLRSMQRWRWCPCTAQGFVLRRIFHFLYFLRSICFKVLFKAHRFRRAILIVVHVHPFVALLATPPFFVPNIGALAYLCHSYFCVYTEIITYTCGLRPKQRGSIAQHILKNNFLSVVYGLSSLGKWCLYRVFCHSAPDDHHVPPSYLKAHSDVQISVMKLCIMFFDFSVKLCFFHPKECLLFAPRARSLRVGFPVVLCIIHYDVLLDLYYILVLYITTFYPSKNQVPRFFNIFLYQYFKNNFVSALSISRF